MMYNTMHTENENEEYILYSEANLEQNNCVCNVVDQR